MKWLMVSGVLVCLMLVGASVWGGPLWWLSLSMPIQQAGAGVVRSVGSVGSWFADVPKLARERDALARERNQLLAQVAQSQAVSRQNDLLRQELQMQKDPQKPHRLVKTAGLVQRNNATYLLVSSGSQDGLRPGQIVTTQGTLVGKILSVQDHASLVTLPFTVGNVIPVQIIDGTKRTTGIVEGTYNLSARLNQVLLADSLTPGQVITTSSDGGVFPPDLVVGKVGTITRDTHQPFQTAAVDLLWDSRTLEYVVVSE